MTTLIFVSLLLILATFLPSFLEAGVLLEAGANGESRSERNGEKNRGVASTATVVVAMVLVRSQLVYALSVWMIRSLDYGESVESGFIISIVSTGAIVLGEVGGKLVALRSPDRAQRAVKPLRRLLAHITPT